MKKRLVSLLLTLALLVLPVVSAGAAQPAAADPTPVQTQTETAEAAQHQYSYIALGDSIVAGIGLPDAVYQRNGRYYDVSGNYQGYSKDCYVARVAEGLDLIKTGSTASGAAYYDLPTLRQELADADLITLLIGSNDTVLQLMGAMGRATNGKATKLLIPLLTGTMRELNLQNLQTLRKGLENLDLTPEELKAALKLLDSGMEEICDQTRGQTVANVEQILQELRALNPDAQIILVGYYNPLPFLPTYGRHFRLLNRSVKALAQQYGADYVSIPYTFIANDGHPTVCGHKYIARQILKAVRK